MKHHVKFVDGEWQIRFSLYDSSEELLAIIDWCKKSFGESGHNKKFCRWRTNWVNHNEKKLSRFWIYNNEDFVAFKLKWL